MCKTKKNPNKTKKQGPKLIFVSVLVSLLLLSDLEIKRNKKKKHSFICPSFTLQFESDSLL